jgi:iron complex transport system substrate-binding protein
MVNKAILLGSALACWLVSAAQAIEMEDDLGARARLEKPPQRIVSLAPSNTELLFALGLGKRVVGVTEYCNYPEEAQSLEKVAGYNTMSLEKVVAVQPDLVLAARGNDLEGVESLRRLGTPVFALDIQSVGQLLKAIERLGRLTGAEEEAAKLKGQLGQRVRRVEKALEGVEERPRVMWGYWSDPVYTAGKSTMIDDVFALAGGDNVGRRAEGAWPQVSLETILAWAPQVIFTTYVPGGPDSLGGEMARLRAVDGWKNVPAVQQGRIYYVEGDWLTRPGPRLVQALEHIARHLHPAAFEGP